VQALTIGVDQFARRGMPASAAPRSDGLIDESGDDRESENACEKSHRTDNAR
jgi:hypothetical protein